MRSIFLGLLAAALLTKPWMHKTQTARTTFCRAAKSFSKATTTSTKVFALGAYGFHEPSFPQFVPAR
jgi:hypothetical protein